MNANSRLLPIIPLVLCGGVGQRLWPLSTPMVPKPFLKLLGDQSFFQTTLLRHQTLTTLCNPVICCNQRHQSLVVEQMAEVFVEAEALILEPSSNNTGPAVMSALQYLANAFPKETLVLILASDHVIDPQPLYLQTLQQGINAYQPNTVLLFGVPYTQFSSEYGYFFLRSETPLPQAILRFIEKPQVQDQLSSVSPHSYINSGLFLATIDQYTQAFQALQPDAWAQCQQAFAQGNVKGNVYQLDSQVYEALTPFSFDKAIIEHLSNLQAMTFPNELSWKDIGGWDTLKTLNITAPSEIS